jgi:acetylornithine deacetylase/succinyl-diaminopimelate desuccinylase-like protein
VLEAALIRARTRQQRHFEWLCDLLRIPSVGTLAEHHQDVERAAATLAGWLRDIGMNGVTLLPTGGPPAVYAEWLGAGADAPTLLAYAHYDVQPADPLEEWRTPPFEPTVRGDDLFARGASDDKSQLLAILAAAGCYLETSGRLPINLRLLFEGEEEQGSPHIADFIARHRERLAADAVLICDQAMADAQTPVITTGVRGMAYMEVEVSGPTVDLHSGTFGGAVDNPLNVLVCLLAALQDPVTHRVTIPGFYDRVRPVADEERALLARRALSDAEALALTGVPALAGEEGYTTWERTSTRPTLDINGIIGGFTQPGHKTVIPTHGQAKVSMRLVPDQEPQEIARLFSDYLHSIAPPTVRLEVRLQAGSHPAVVDPRAPAVQAAARAYERAFGASPVYQRGGGSLPIVHELQQALGAPVVMIGFGLPDDNGHAPNEKMHLPNFYRGIETVIHYLALLGLPEEEW